jgi:hypothetical protein
MGFCFSVIPHFPWWDNGPPETDVWSYSVMMDLAYPNQSHPEKDHPPTQPSNKNKKNKGNKEIGGRIIQVNNYHLPQ